MAGALYHVRAITNLPSLPIFDNLMPSESGYADDCDFLSSEENDKYSLKDLLPRIKETFSDWNLKINNSKTEYVDVYLSENTTERGKKLEKYENYRIANNDFRI